MRLLSLNLDSILVTIYIFAKAGVDGTEFFTAFSLYHMSILNMQVSALLQYQPRCFGKSLDEYLSPNKILNLNHNSGSSLKHLRDLPYSFTFNHLDLRNLLFRFKGFYQQKSTSILHHWYADQMGEDELFTEMIKAFMKGKRRYIGTIASNFLLFSLHFESVLALVSSFMHIFSHAEAHVYIF